jgi:hypothetical protein
MNSFESISNKNFEEPKLLQIIEILKLGGIENVGEDIANKIMNGTDIDQKDQMLIGVILEEWQTADEKKKEDLAFTFTNIMKRGKYLKLED